jgi:N-acetylneuraminate lyase
VFRLIAAPFTPFSTDGEVDYETIHAQAESLVRNRVQGAFICGTTGESMSLAIAERIEIAKRWVDAAAGRLEVIVHVGHTCLEDCRQLAAQAQEIGADGIAAMAPCFARPASIEELVDFTARTASAAPELPFYYYHIPGMTGVDLPMAAYMPRAAERIPNLAGLKFSHWNLMDLGQVIEMDDGRFEVFFGSDEILLSAMALGVRGAVGSTYNLMAPLYHRMIAAFDAGNLADAQRLQHRALAIVARLFEFGPRRFAAIKAVMKHVGVDCGGVRPPITPLSGDDESRLAKVLAEVGFDEVRSASIEPTSAPSHV